MVESVFTEFIEISPEAYCRWRCDVEEYIVGAGIVQPMAKIKAGTQLLSQTHKSTWENMILQVVPVGLVTTDQEVDQIHAAFALTFMDETT